MKLNALLGCALLALAESVLAAPAQKAAKLNGRDVLIKRASTTDVPTTGYATTNGGTTGGNGGEEVTVSSYDELASAVDGDDPRIVIVEGTISQSGKIDVGANKSILGRDSSAVLDGVSLSIEKPNVIVRNLSVRKVLADNGDAIHIQGTEVKNVWIDHCDLSSDMDHDKDYYDGLLDITHGSDFITISNTYFHDHWKTSLVGHSDNNGDEDSGHLTVTYANNYWSNLHSRGPSFRFGSGHIFNSYYENMKDVINVRITGQVLVESNVFSGCDKALYSGDDDGGAVANGNDWGESENTAPQGNLNSVPYSYDLLGSGSVKSAVVGTAGATLQF